MAFNETERTLLFWTVCLPVRFGIYKLAKRFSGDETPNARLLLRVAAGVFSCAWLVIYGTHTDKTFFGGNAWWADKRPFHASLYGFYSVTGRYQSLLADVILAAVFWLNEKTVLLKAN